ncbi:MAG: hypothetical protein MUP85_11325 [Candidatus Lokiarchaeota archaeon]|nr:hypothetical protein [Candidatus Lokiarchaeota archaeon]
MKPNKKVLDAILLMFIIVSIIVPITIIEQLKSNILTNTILELNRGFQVTYDEIPQSDPIVILNPKECNIFYHSRIYLEYILLNYRTAPGVTAEEYILDSEAPQSIPPDNTIQTPEIGNHTLILTGKNSTGGSCSSKLVNFYIGRNIRGVCGAAPEVYDYTYSSTVHLALSSYGYGLITDTEFEQEIFLEGPKIFNTEIYAKNVDLKFEAIVTFVPFIILRSEPWYDHSVEVINSHWVNLVSGGKIVDRIWITSGTLYRATDGETEIIYFLVSLLHVFGTVTYWNEETRYYDVFNIERICYDNTYHMSYGANESILEYPILGPIDFSQFSDVYHDKNMTENEIWEWQKHEDWIQSYGVEASVFLGNYAGVDSCPVPVRFSLPQLNIKDNELVPDEITHLFTRTDYQPETFEANYRGLENTFSMNIIPT